MESQLARILGSNVNTEVASSIEHNEEEIQKLEQILNQKNSEVFSLHQKINFQLFATVQQNQKLKKSNEFYKIMFSKLKSEVESLRKFVKLSAFDCLESIMKGFDELGVRLKQKDNIIEKEECYVQTEFSESKSSQRKLLQRLENLEKTVLNLKEEKWQIQKELNKYQNAFNVEPEYNSINSNQALSEEQMRGIILRNVKNHFENILQEKYCGEIIGNEKHGEGYCEYVGNFSYEGMFFNGKRSGLGTIKYKDEVIYEGYWKNDVFHGKGVLYYLQDESVEKFAGVFCEGDINGYGTLNYLNGQKIRAKWKKGEIDGNAMVEDENGIYYGCAVPESRIKTEQNYLLSA